MGTILDDVAVWVSELTYDDIPERIREKARLQVLSMIAAVLSGRYYGALSTMVPGALPGGEASMLADNRKTSAGYAAFVNALYSMSFDYDDYLFMGHTGHSAVLVPLALAEEAGLKMRDLLVAQVAANEVEGRLGASVLLGHHNGQMWSYLHAAGAAVAASKLTGLSREQTASAIALALYQPNYPLAPGFMLSDSKLLTASIPLMTGMLCTGLARTGMKGNSALIESDHGFLSRFAYLPLPHLLSGFGQWWVTDTIAFKPYPGCAYIDTAIDSVSRILHDYTEKTGTRLAPRDIQRVDVFANILTVGMNALSEAYDDGTLHPVNINFSIPKSVALALVHGSLQAGHLSSDMLARHAQGILPLSRKIRLHHDWQYTLKMQSSFYDSLGGKFVLGDAGVFRLLWAFRRIRKDLPRAPLDIPGLFTAWRALPAADRKAIREGMLRQHDHVRMETFVFSFGARVRIETNGRQAYEAESVVPKGASPSDQKEVVLDKLSHTPGIGRKAGDLYDLLGEQTPVREFVRQLQAYTVKGGGS